MRQTKLTHKNPIMAFLLFFVTGSLYAGTFSGDPATLHFDLNECTSYFSDQTNQDYSEFTATASNTNLIQLSAVGGNLYRNNPTANTHSCTPGVNGTEGMCVSFDSGCNYNPESEKAVRFDVNVVPLASETVSLTGLDFYEKSPLQFDWIDGATGQNNYPLFYGVRVKRGGVTIFEQSGISTNLDWTLQNFDFSGDDAFTVSTATFFSFELLAYCPVGISSAQSVWDVDEITITAECNSGPCAAEGGTLAGGPFAFCVGDDIADNIAADQITLSGNSGTNSQWVVTDDQGNILGLPPTFTAVNFDGAGAGTCLVWHLSFEDGLVGAAVGNNAADLVGCYSLSNSISVTRYQPEGGTLAGGPFAFCVGDGVADNIAANEISLSGNSGTNSQWVVTDDQGNILGLPPTFSAVDFDGAGVGTCLVWHLSFEDGLTGAAVGNNAADLGGCYSLSNPISVVRSQPVGGTLSGGPFEFCVGDGVADNIGADMIVLAGNSGANSQWVVTDDQGNILGLPPTFSAVDFDGAGAGTCLVWHLSFEDGLTGAAVGNNASDLGGCYSLSNPISVTRNQPVGGTLTGGPFEFCVGDGVADNIAADQIVLSGNSGANSQWVITDDQGNILGLPPTFSAVDFDGAGAGTCLVWHLSFGDGLTGAAVGNNASDLGGCYSLSNPISVTRNQPVGGTLTGGPFSFIVGDGVDDNIGPNEITLTGNSGTNSQWVVTDDQGNILGLPPTFSAVNFEGAGAGTCLVWHLSFEDGLTGAAVGNNAADLGGCYNLSNPITVVRTEGGAVVGGVLAGGPFEFCVGDGVADNLAPGSITLTGNSGTNSQWVVTDDQGMILGLPPMPSAVDFDGAGAGTCLVWHLSFEDGLMGAAVGNNASDLVGTFSLSNSIAVVRNQPEGGVLTGGPFSFTVGDGIADNLAPGSIALAGNSGANSQWVVTDDQGMILGLPPMPSAVDFDGAGAGTCLIWHLSFEDGLMGAAMGNNAMTDLVGCYNLSNPISVVRTQGGAVVAGGTLTGGPFEFCVGDGVADNIAPGSITLTGNSGMNSQWVVTDDQMNILGLPPMPSAVDFDGAGAGTCIVWHLSFQDGLTGAAVGNNAMTDLVGTFSLSNGISVTRNQPEGGTLTGGPFSFTVGDGVADNIAAGDITLAGNSGTNSQWVVTDDQGNILGLPPSFTDVDFDGAGAGTCLVWHLSFEDGLTGAAVGNNASDLVGCFNLSNSISVVRTTTATTISGGTIAGGPFEFCVGDGVADNIAPGSITLTGNTGMNSQWVVTDDQGMILGLPPMPSAVDFDGAGAGTCLIWHLSFEDGLTGAVVGNNAMTDLVGTYSLSNSISVTRNQPEGGTLTGGPFSFTVGDGVADNIAAGDITLAGNSGTNSQWVVTDDQGNILGLPPSFTDVDFDGAGAGTCLVWHLSFEDGLTGAVVGNNASDLVGCFSLSNSLSVERIDAGGCNAMGGTLTGGPFTFTEIGDGVPDMIPAGSITLANNSGMNSQWVVTDSQGIILGLPPMPGAVDFDGAGSGTCLIWHLSFDGVITGAEVGMNANDITGCWSLSNSIEVIRENASGCQANGGELFGGPFTFTEIGDGVPDMIPAGSITLANASGMNGQWVVTDANGVILGLPPMPGAVDFDGAGAGNCLIWYLSFDDGLMGAAIGNNAMTDLVGCHSLSNSIEVIRENASGCQANGGELFGGPFTFTEIGDGVPDMIPAGSITLANNSGMNSQWVVTDFEGNILGLPPMPGAVDFDGAGSGNCFIWHLSFDDGLTGAVVGNNALTDLVGCYSISNSIEVIRENADGCQSNGGELFGGPFIFTEIGDGVADTIAVDSIVLANRSGMNSQWVITDSNGIILGLPPTYSAVNFDGAGSGNCLIWHLSFDDGLIGAEIGNNAMTDLVGCHNLSNSIEVIRENADGCQANGGELFGGPFEFTEVGDGVPDMIPAGSITLANASGMNGQWVITDDQGMILGLPPMPGAVDFDGAGVGTCLIWYLSFDDGLTGAVVGNNAMTDLVGCHNLSNSIAVVRSSTVTATDSIVINEIFGGNLVEIKNVGLNSIDISSYILCDFPSYAALEDLVLSCGGDLILDPQEIVTVEFDFSSADGEMGLYTSAQYTNPDAIIDYVEWGSSGHTRASVAIAAGIWTAGDFVAAFDSSMSIEYDGTGNTSMDWSEDANTPCEENDTLVSESSELFSFTAFPNPTIDYLLLESDFDLDATAQYSVFNKLGTIMAQGTMDELETSKLDTSNLPNGTYFLNVTTKYGSSTKNFIKVN